MRGVQNLVSSGGGTNAVAVIGFGASGGLIIGGILSGALFSWGPLAISLIVGGGLLIIPTACGIAVLGESNWE